MPAPPEDDAPLQLQRATSEAAIAQAEAAKAQAEVEKLRAQTELMHLQAELGMLQNVGSSKGTMLARGASSSLLRSYSSRVHPAEPSETDTLPASGPSPSRRNLLQDLMNSPRD
jgi:hypothetical protein